MEVPWNPSPEGGRPTIVHSLGSQLLVGTNHATQGLYLVVFSLRRSGINRLFAQGKCPVLPDYYNSGKNHILSYLDYEMLIARHYEHAFSFIPYFEYIDSLTF